MPSARHGSGMLDDRYSAMKDPIYRYQIPDDWIVESWPLPRTRPYSAEEVRAILERARAIVREYRRPR